MIQRDLHELIDQRRDQIFADYVDLLKIPSISTLRSHQKDVRRAARFVADLLKRNGLEHVAIIKTEGAPLVYGDWLHAPGKPTVLIYAHYDVQPVDPLKEWETPPFTPTVKGDLIYGRGVCDDKNQAIATIHAVGAHLTSDNWLPVNIRFLFEGEEESGGEAIEHFVQTKPERIPCDIVLVCDGAMYTGQPTVNYGCRGIIYTEILARGAQHDLHSGGYGGVAPNPFFALAQIVAGLKDINGHITIPGLYELMQPISTSERALWHRIDRDYDAHFKQEIGRQDCYPGCRARQSELAPRPRPNSGQCVAFTSSTGSRANSSWNPNRSAYDSRWTALPNKS
jgi:acetylornithine deacetylase/succinyl-diaminopimelate desuccinylase-like protein